MVPYTALVVDDSRVARFAMSVLLKGRGFNVDVAASGEAALRYLQQHKPDIVFMDIMMPGMGGIEATRAILSHEATSFLPVIMCTGQATQTERSTALKGGAREILIKPVAGENLDRVLRMLAMDSELSRVEAPVSPGREPTTGAPVREEIETKVHPVAHKMTEQLSSQWVEVLATDVAKRVAREMAEVISYRTANEVLEAAQELAERKARLVTEMILVQASLEVASKAEKTVKAMVRTASEQAAAECLKQQQDKFHRTLQETAEHTVKAIAEKQVAMVVARYLPKLEKKGSSWSL